MTRAMALLALVTACGVMACRVADPLLSNPSNGTGPPADNPDGDADTDADADTDTAPPQDTAPPEAWDGEYEGLIGANVSYQATSVSGVQVYQCTGPFEVSVGSGSPGITGEGVCAGSLSGRPEALLMTLTGDITTFPAAGGTITVSHADFTFDDLWDGTFEDDELDAQATDMIAGEPTINWFVNFTVDR